MGNMLKIVLPRIVSESQSAFVKNRHITDNVSIAYELIHASKNRRQGKEG